VMHLTLFLLHIIWQSCMLKRVGKVIIAIFFYRGVYYLVFYIDFNLECTERYCSLWEIEFINYKCIKVTKGIKGICSIIKRFMAHSNSRKAKFPIPNRRFHPFIGSLHI
jgi:hypothetical protein